MTKLKSEFSSPQSFIDQATQKEIDWWEPEIISEKDLPYAIQDGRLVRIPNTGKNGYRLIFTLRSGQEPPYCRPELLSLIEEIAKRWRDQITQIYGEITASLLFISITSLYRPESLQEKLVTESNLLNARRGISSHQAGAAVDIDPRAFYYQDPRSSEYQPINQNNLPPELSPEKFEKIKSLLKQVLIQLQEENKINFLIEYKGDTHQNNCSQPSVYHVCLNPTIISRN